MQRFSSPYSSSFSDSVVVSGRGRWIHVSGQVGAEEGKPVTATDFGDEVDLCIANIQKSLERAGASLSDVVRITAYLTKLELYPAYNEARAKAFSSAPPASATVQVAGLLANASIEMDAVAFVEEPG